MHNLHEKILDHLNVLYINFLTPGLLLDWPLELMISDRHQKREIKQLEQELPRWQVLVDNITGMLNFTHLEQADQGSAFQFDGICLLHHQE